MHQPEPEPSLFPALLTLRQHPHWVCWRKEVRRGKSTKVPYNPHTGRFAASDKPETWAPYEDAQRAYEQSQGWKRPYDGIGYMFAGAITGVDFDHCTRSDGTLEGWAQERMGGLASYTERSPSKTGLHVLLLGTVARGTRRKVPQAWGASHPDAAIELYSQWRYFTITGDHLEGTPTTLEANQDALDALIAELTAGETSRASENEKRNTSLLRFSSGGSGSSGDAPVRDRGIDDDMALLERAEHATNGRTFASLYYHGLAGYPSASEADLALCLMLAFWTGKDARRMDRLYRKSALYRDKWDGRRGDTTYGAETIAKAISLCRRTYDPHFKQKQLDAEINELLSQIDHDRGKTTPAPYRITPKDVPTANVLEYLDENEWGDARLFAQAFAGQVCYDHTEKEWYLWAGHHWRRDTTARVRALVAGMLGSLYLHAAASLNTQHAELDAQLRACQGEGANASDSERARLKERAKALAGQMGALRARAAALRTSKRTSAMLTYVQSLMGVTAELWDSDPWLLAVPNGVIDLRTGTRRDGLPTDHIRTVAPTEWRGLDVPCPRFEQFLEEVFEDKADRDALVAFVHRLLGYGITGLVTLHLFAILYGEAGRNGKDTLLGVLQHVLGPFVGPVSNDVFIAQDKLRTAGAATPHLVDLQGKRIVWGSETKQGDRLNIAQIKHLTGGGDISARQLHGHQFAFHPTHTLFLMTNYKPHADARDQAFWARAILIDFGMRFVERPQAANERMSNPTLKETLHAEASGILAWLVRGCLTWQREGLSMPESVRLATDKYREEEDKLLQFLQECCLIAPHACVGAKALFEAYRTWCEDNQYGRGMNMKLFGEEMKKKFDRDRSEDGRVYKGIGLLALEQEQGGLFPVGSLSRTSSPNHSDEPAPQAHAAESNSSVECRDVGSVDIFPLNQRNDTPIEGKHGITLHTLHSSVPVQSPEPASEADPSERLDEALSEGDPTSTSDPHRCIVRWEEWGNMAHQAEGTAYSAGCWWCDRCTPHRLLMERGERDHFPKLDVTGAKRPFKVKAGRQSWLRFVCSAGERSVRAACESLQEREDEA